MRTAVLTLRLDAALLEWVRAQALTEGRSMSNWIRRLIVRERTKTSPAPRKVSRK